jgi:hypothetical protein
MDSPNKPSIASPERARQPAEGWLGRHDLWALGLGLLLLGAWLSYLRLHSHQAHGDSVLVYLLSLCQESALRFGTDCSEHTPYPPLVVGNAVAHYLLRGEHSLAWAIQSQWPFVTLLMASLYLGLRWEQGRWLALVALALGPMLLIDQAPAIGLSLYTEVGMAGSLVGAAACLAACRGFTRPWASLGVGVFVAMTILSKWTGAFFVGPVLWLAVSFALIRLGRRWWLGLPVVLLLPPYLACVGLSMLGAFRWGLPVAGVLATVGLLWLVGCRLLRPRWFAAGADRRLLSLGLAGLALLVLAWPWYYGHQAELIDYFGANIDFDGDTELTPLAEHWHYYLVQLLTRALPTPLLVLAGLGTLRLMLPKRSPMAAWSLLLFVSGLAGMTLLPFGNHRYLAGGYGLLVPVMVGLVVGLPLAVRLLLAPVLVWALVHQLQWLLPHQMQPLSNPALVSLVTPTRRPLAGGNRQGLAESWEAWGDLGWYLPPPKIPPVRQQTLQDRIGRGVSRDLEPDTPLAAVVFDPLNRFSSDQLSAAMMAAGAGWLPRVHGTSSLDCQSVRRELERASSRAQSRPGVPRVVFVQIFSDEQSQQPDTAPSLSSCGLSAYPFEDQDWPPPSFRLWLANIGASHPLGT